MAGTVNWERLRELAGFRVEKGCAISLYLNLDPSVAATAGELQPRINSLLDEAEKSEAASRPELGHDERLGVRADLERIREFFASDFSRDGAHGFAIFSAGLDNFWSTLALLEPVPDDVKVGADFYLAPLVPLVGRGDGALVAVVGRERGQIHRLRGGKLEELADHFEEQPRRHDQGGRAQARFQRHVDTLAHEHLRDVAELLDRHVRRLRSPAVVVVASEDTRAAFSDLISSETRSALVGWAHAEAHASPAELLAVVSPLLEEERAETERKSLERWGEESGRNGRATGGWGPTLEAASDGRVELLLYQEGVRRPAWQCPACGRAALDGRSCPLDGTSMERRNEGLDLAVHQTLAHGGTVWAVRRRRDLEQVEGIAALLRY